MGAIARVRTLLLVLPASLLLLTGVQPDAHVEARALSCGPGTSVQFQDVSAQAKISYTGKAWGAAWGDFDGDGYPDLWTSNHTARPSLWVNQKNGTFVNVGGTAQPIRAGIDTHGAAWGDFNNDGLEDLIVMADQGGGTVPQPILLVNTGSALQDRTVALGLDYRPSRGRTPLWLDYDRDGRLDVFMPMHRRAGGGDLPTALFHQVSGVFQDVTLSVGLQALSVATQFAQLSDLTGDDILDLVTQSGAAGESGASSGGYPTHVYDMTTVPFTDRLSTVGLRTILPMQDAALADFNNDGNVDLFLTGGELANDVLQFNPTTVHARLQPRKNEKGFRFVGTGSATFDIQPKYLVDRLGNSRIYIGASGRHPTVRPFTLSSSDPANAGIYGHTAGVSEGVYIGYTPSTRTWQVRYSKPGKGDFTFVVTNTNPVSNVTAIGWDATFPGPMNHLFINVSPGQFQDTISSSGVAVRGQSVNVAAADFNNDMYVDLFIVNARGAGQIPDQLFLNDGDGTFTGVPSAGGAAGTNVGRGDVAAAADYDLNGFMDLIVTNGRKPDPFWGPYQLFRNAGNGNHWLEVDLRGTLSNRDAIGARVWATTGGVTQLRERGGGIHERGAQDFDRIHFGLGCNTTVDTLVIRWPGGIVQQLTDVPADQVLMLAEPRS